MKNAEVLPVKLLSPLYAAVTVCSPGVRVVVLALVAEPVDNATGAPKFTPSMTN